MMRTILHKANQLPHAAIAAEGIPLPVHGTALGVGNRGTVDRRIGVGPGSPPDGWRTIPTQPCSIASAPATEPATKIPYNLHVGISAEVINRFYPAADERRPIRDSILGADVVGRQTTLTQIEIVCRRIPTATSPCDDGTAHTETLGVTQKAAVSSVGRHRFRATKGVVFDGARSPRSSRNPGRPAETMWSALHRPGRRAGSGDLAGRHGDARAQRRASQTEAIARDRLSGRILPEFQHASTATGARETASWNKPTGNDWKRGSLADSAAAVHVQHADLLQRLFQAEGRERCAVADAPQRAPNGSCGSTFTKPVQHLINR